MNGLEALNLAKRLKPDAVVMDIEMPMLDGVEATRQLANARRICRSSRSAATTTRSACSRSETPVRTTTSGKRGSRPSCRACSPRRHNPRVTKQRLLAAVREIALGLPETSERLSHGAPTFFVREKRSFATIWDNHHGDGRFASICAAPEGLQAALVDADPGRFYVPPYVGHRGWIGVRLDRGFERDEIAGFLEDAYAEVA